MTADADTSFADPGGETGLVYDGRTGELLVLCLKIFLLNVVTLGFYRFWGRTRVRKYLWGHVNLNGDRFAYDGTGGELFLRFLVALLVIVPLFLLVAIVSALAGGRALMVIARIAQAVLIVYLSFFAYYTGRRYRLSRTTWRGIRGGLEGSANRYALMSFAFVPLQIITLGLAAPWQFVALRRYEARNAGFGDENFRFEGTGRGVIGAYLVAWFMALGVILLPIAAGAIAYAKLGPAAARDGHALPAGLAWIVVPAIIVFVLYFLAVVAAYVRYWARALNYVAQCTRFRGVSFAASVRTRSLFWLQFGNLLLALFTFGFGAPLAAHRYTRFFCANLRLDHAEDLERLSQQPGRRPRKGGEGLLQVLDTGGFA
jgi:uncharacterized membrane protein YjgN (DUF898 family)